MAMERAQPTSFTVQLPTAIAPVTGTINGVALTTNPVHDSATKDSYLVSLSALETDVNVGYILLVDASGEEFGFTLVFDEFDRIDEVLSDNHGYGPWSESILSDTPINHLTEVDENGNIVSTGEGNPLGVSTPGASLTVFYKTDEDRVSPQRRTTAAGDGTWSLLVPSGELVISVSKNGYYDETEGDSVLEVEVVVP